MLFNEFTAQVRRAGLQSKDCGDGHWQILGGGFLVNYWDETRRGPVFCVSGMKGQPGGVKQAIEAASQPPATERGKRKGKKWSQRMRRRLLERDPRCRWCGCDLNFETCTLDHVIPLGKGGHSGDDNVCLACDPCNKEKRDTMPVRVLPAQSVPVEVYEWV